MEAALQAVNHAVLRLLNPEQVEVKICRADDLEEHCGLSSELDEMWSLLRRAQIESAVAVAMACH
jgi:hypothetical protein